ncbi:MAG: hypothetical protein V3S22_04745 [Candidatus Neomarinimicrobiota bacterium]
MSQWIITPDKYLIADEVKRMRNTCQEHSIIAKSKGNLNTNLYEKAGKAKPLILSTRKRGL